MITTNKRGHLRNFLFVTRFWRLETIPLKLHRQRSSLIQRPLGSWDSWRRGVSLYALGQEHYNANYSDVPDTIYGLRSLAQSRCQEAVPVEYTCSAYALCGRILQYHLSFHKESDATADVFEDSRELYRRLVSSLPHGLSWTTYLEKCHHISDSHSGDIDSIKSVGGPVSRLFLAAALFHPVKISGGHRRLYNGTRLRPLCCKKNFLTIRRWTTPSS